MSYSDVDSDDVDQLMRRESAVLREQVTMSADTDGALEDFTRARTDGRSVSARGLGSRARWATAAAIGLVAAAVAIALVAKNTDDTPPIDRLGTTTTAPSPTAVPLAALSVRVNGELIASSPSGTPQVVGRIPESIMTSPQIAGGWPSGIAGYVAADVSSAGRVAVTGFMSEGFWFFDLHDPATSPRFVSLAGPAGGHTSAGVWNPQGTLYAAVELDRTLAIIDPVTGDITRLGGAHPPIGYPPTWTADGTAILVGDPISECVEQDDPTRDLVVAPIAGGPEIATIPALADGLNHVSRGGIWSNDNRCTKNPSEGEVTPISDIVVVGPTRPKTWVDGTDVDSAELKGSAFATARQTLWVLAEDIGSRRMLLYEVSSPHSTRLVNAVDDGVVDGSFPFIFAVAPDDSSVVVLMNGPNGDRKFYLVPTDGSPATTLDGEASGFVPSALVDTVVNQR